MSEKAVNDMSVEELRAELGRLASQTDGDLQARAFDVFTELGKRDTASVHHTANGVQITDGLAVWDYDLRAGRVDFHLSRVTSPHFDGWFTVVHQGGGRSLMNGERLTTRHPFTGQPASDALPPQ